MSPQSDQNAQDEKPPERIVPKQIRFTTRGFVYRAFTFKERLLVLMGYRLLVEIHIASEHNPGQTQPLTKFHLTPEKTQAAAFLKLRDEVAAESKARGVEPNTVPDLKK